MGCDEGERSCAIKTTSTRASSTRNTSSLGPIELDPFELHGATLYGVHIASMHCCYVPADELEGEDSEDRAIEEARRSSKSSEIVLGSTRSLCCWSGCAAFAL